MYVVCRRGNDSQVVVRKIRDEGVTECWDLVGGLKRYSEEIDSDMPIY